MTPENTGSVLLGRSRCLCGAAFLPGEESSPLYLTAAKRHVPAKAKGSVKGPQTRNERCSGLEQSGEWNVCAVSDAGVPSDRLNSLAGDVMHC